MTRAIIYLLIGLPIIYDLLAVRFKWGTVTENVRTINYESGQLIMLGWIALFIHFWIVPLFVR